MKTTGASIIPFQRPTERTGLTGPSALKFVAQSLGTPHLARVVDDGVPVLFVRFAARLTQDEIAVPPGLHEEVRVALTSARREGKAIRRAVVVGTDVLFPGTKDEVEPLAEARDDDNGYHAVLDDLVGLFKIFADEQVSILWRTRGGLVGHLPTPLANALPDLAEHLSFEIGLPTLDDDISRALEGPGVAPAKARLRLATAVHARGVPVRGLIDPLVPMLTDTPASLEPLLGALRDAGVHRVGIRYLALTRGRAKQLAAGLSKMQRALIRGCFQGQPWLPADPTAEVAHARGPHKLLPESLRERGHRRVTQSAARLGIAVYVLDPASTAEGPSESRQKTRRRPKLARPQLDLFRVRSK